MGVDDNCTFDIVCLVSNFSWDNFDNLIIEQSSSSDNAPYITKGVSLAQAISYLLEENFEILNISYYNDPSRCLYIFIRENKSYE